MATFYLDYEGGSDAADGTSFANRWKTITSGATAARIAPGDTIRVMGSPAPTSLGISATWTNKSATVTLASALNALITNCDSAWTASANVTSTADTIVYRTSTGSAKHVIASGFTTGLASYFALGGAQDYSAYQGITLWVYVTVKTLAAGELSIRLCSDAAGVTTVDTLALPAITQLSQWVPVHIDKGSALGSSIQSIALYVDTDNGAITVNFDNISTTKAVGNDCLTLKSLIGKNSGANEYWWAIRQINGTALTLDATPSMASSGASRGYYGTTESVTTYQRQTTPTALVSGTTTASQTVQDSGTAGNLITFSGGWDRTNMSTQTLETWFDGQSGNGYGLASGTADYIAIDKLNFVRYYRGFVGEGSADHWQIEKIYAGNNYYGIHFNTFNDSTTNELHIWGSWLAGFENTNGARWTITKLRMVTCGSSVTSSAWTTASAGDGHFRITTYEAYNSDYYGLHLGSSGSPTKVWVGTMTLNDNGQAGIFAAISSSVAGWRIDTLNAAGHAGAGVNLSNLVGDIHIGSLTSTNNAYGLVVPITLRSYVLIDSLTTSGNSSAGVSATIIAGITVIRKSSIAETTKVGLASSGYVPDGGGLTFQDFNGTAGDHRTYLYAGGSGIGHATVFSESSVRHTASGLAWKMSVYSDVYLSSDWPATWSFAKIYLPANVTKTITAWVRRTNTGLTARMRIKGGQLDGISTTQIATAAAAQDTWEQLSISVTPTVAGVIDVELLAHGGTTYSVYIDDLGVS